MTACPGPGSLAATEFLDHGAPGVRHFAAQALEGVPDTDRDRAVALYYAVRDGIRYEVYGADLSRAGLRASSVVEARSGMCLHKSVLYAAALRSVGVPARLVLTDVRNHLASDRLRELAGGDVFTYHCLTSAHLDGRWLRATPVFNRTLCRLYRLDPLEFDGTADSVHHPHDRSGRRHMEFLREHGEFDDLPHARVVAGLRAAHPRLFDGPTTPTTDTLTAGSLVAEATDPPGAPR
ncbi:transglutaminase-like domain-containing protein [Actinokineospora auranticolor]|uniref:Transglutaminase superfamily protein n=1 Tax=Actinokineospora auranticolor TaxID=155976 RepID=A0A2S6GTA7_9PSEU|nr:transglutaminase-like domain-containing protein [Actinokineospora auranticolor]PPK68413.1 transglutaminase superfamily protein [Actinokineospora auranticolor]